MLKIPTPPSITVPLREDEHGAIRIGDTRMLLELVIRAYQRGETPEGIVDSYSTLSVADVYAVISYYLSHQAEIDAYVRQRDDLAKEIRQQIEANMTPEQKAFRARLRAIKAAR